MQGKLGEAEKLYKQVIPILEKTGSPNLASGLNNLALVYMAQVSVRVALTPCGPLNTSAGVWSS